MLHTYPHDYKVVFVGDASMSPYEITAQGGSVEHFNDEPGALWLERVTRTYPAAVWLNPVPEKEWDFTYSIQMVRQLMGGRMYPLTLEGWIARCGSWCGNGPLRIFPEALRLARCAGSMQRQQNRFKQKPWTG